MQQKNHNLQFVEDAIANGAIFASAGDGQYVVDHRKFEADHEAAARHLAGGGKVEVDNGYSDIESGEYINGDYISTNIIVDGHDLDTADISFIRQYLLANYAHNKFEIIEKQ